MVTPKAPKTYELKTVESKDGTTIGYRQLGRGPGLVLIHGGMMAAHSFMKLATALSDDFTVFIPDRRGRGSSGSFGRDYGLRKEVEDVAAIIDRTGAHCVFGLSSGAIIALESALQLPVIRKLALYEPPLSINGSNPAAWLPRYDSEIAAGNLPAAMVSVSKGVPVSPVFSRLPRLIGTLLMRLAIPAEAKQTKNDDVSLAALIPTMHSDAQVVVDAAEQAEQLSRCEISRAATRRQQEPALAEDRTRCTGCNAAERRARGDRLGGAHGRGQRRPTRTRRPRTPPLLHSHRGWRRPELIAAHRVIPDAATGFEITKQLYDKMPSCPV